MQLEQEREKLPNIFQQLEHCQKEFLTKKNQLFRSFIHSFTSSSEESDILFTSFNGWGREGAFLEKEKEVSSSSMHFLATNSFCPIHNGGYFFQYKNRGIVINPGRDFLKRFYAKGHNIREIHCVIVTTNTKEAYEDLLSIYTCNSFINQHLNDALALHKITYYLHPDIYPELIGSMPPKYKNEKGAVQSLDHFEDAPQETIKIAPDIDLSYFSKGKGIAIKLTFSHEETPITFGYASFSFTPHLTTFFKECSLLLLGIGATPEEDLERLSYEKEHLGYFGAFSLLEGLPNLPLVLLGELQPNLGDIRLEIAQKLLYDLEKSLKNPLPKIIPLEVDCSIALSSLSFMTNVLKRVSYKDIAVYRKAPFSPLAYIAKTALL